MMDNLLEYFEFGSKKMRLWEWHFCQCINNKGFPQHRMWKILCTCMYRWDYCDNLFTESDFYASSEADHTPSSYLRTIVPKWKKLVKSSDLKHGSPLVLIVTSSAIRAVQLNRYVLTHISNLNRQVLTHRQTFLIFVNLSCCSGL